MSAADLGKALCQQVGGDLFYPERGEDTERAKAVCRSCEARLPCLAYSLEIGDREGIFGGFTERVRRRLASEHRAGKPLEDIIADDDAAYYARIESRGRTPEARRLASERRRRSEKRARLAGAAAPTQPRKAVA